MTNIIDVESKIITLREQQVILDADVAELYGVQTKEINQAVKNNPDKFPDGYIWEITDVEKQELVKNFDRFNRQKHSSVTPRAFTEKGLYMLATILKSPKAVETTIAIVEAYAKLKELSRVMVALPQVEESEAGKQEQNRLLHRGGQLIDDLLTDLLPGQSRETSFELNLAMFKFRHSVKRENDAEVRELREEIARLKQRLGD